jgi:hypothetical protein
VTLPATPVTVEPRGTMLPPSPALADLCREAALLLDRYDDAVGVAQRAAFAGGRPMHAAIRAIVDLQRDIDSALAEVAYALGQASDDRATLWRSRAWLAAAGVVVADAWSVELLRLAAEWEGERSTEPEVGQ